MNCPKCGLDIDFGSPRCARCGVDYLESFEKRAWGKASATRAPRRRRKGWWLPRKRWLAAGAAVAGLVAWFGAAPPSGLPQPPGSILESGHGFSYIPPSGWEPDGGTRRRGAAVVAVALQRGPAVIEVLVAPVSMDDAAERPRSLLETEFNGIQARMEQLDFLEVDRLRAVRIGVAGERVLLRSANEGRRNSALQQAAPAYESMDFRGTLVVVPGAGRTYVLKMFSEKGDFAGQEPAFRALVESFRVLERPFSVGHLRRALARWVG